MYIHVVEIQHVHVPCVKRLVHLRLIDLPQFDQGGVHKEVSVTFTSNDVNTRPSVNNNLLILVDRLINL